MSRATVPVALTVAGLDPSGGAGVAADLRAFARCSVYAGCVVTAVTVQNTAGVASVHPLAAKLVRAQLEAVVADLPVVAVKVGMVGRGETARAIAASLRAAPLRPAVVVDPVLAASAGGRLLEEGGIAAGLVELVGSATVVTPNLGEARALAAAAFGKRSSRWPAQRLAAELLALGPRAVVVTGVRSGGRVVDLFAEQGLVRELSGPPVQPASAHGSGCTHSALLAAQLALGRTPLAAARRARALTAQAISRRLEVGRGVGPADVLGLRRG